MSRAPQRSLAETEAILCAPQNIHETETALVDGRLYRVYKNLWPSCRDFWLSAVSQYADRIYIVYEDQRLTYRQVHERAIKVATLFRKVYRIRKGDRVGICSRNYPDYLVAFWACHLIGAVTVLANAWLPLGPLRHCLSYTGCKLILVDPERASVLEPITSQLMEEDGVVAFFVLDQCNRSWRNMQSLDKAVDACVEYDDAKDLLTEPIDPEDNATIIFTSGTTGLPKGVLSTQRQFLTNVLNVLAGGFRAALRRGDPLPSVQRPGLQAGALVAVPLFHVTGSTSYSMMATLTGMKIILARKWIPEEADRGSCQAARLIREENVGVAGGVPSMVADLTESSLVGHPLEGLLFGGSPTPDSLVGRAQKAFPKATMTQGYGLTETNSIAVSISGDDYISRPTSTGLACPVNEIKIVAGGKCLPPNGVGEVWLRGPNVMKGYWNDPGASQLLP
ncbi:2-succinylbenzoate--CoA ligase [Leucoagaricus sp. SymC.cos]|nr:2-succinylbenzoate--CoA ligase [Leucoagaricus sp. SymC.cos]